MGCVGSVESVDASNTNSNSNVNETVTTSPFPKLGLKLCAFDEFIEKCGGYESIKDYSTNDICQKFIKNLDSHVFPKQHKNEQTYCAYLQKLHPNKVGIASVFISHAWSYKFVDSVKALKYHFKDDENVCVWFDLFSNNQSKNETLPFSWWSGTFQSAIQQFGRTVLILQPWNNPVPLTRAWCLFEIYCTAITKSKLEIAMPSAEESSFLKAISEEVNRFCFISSNIFAYEYI